MKSKTQSKILILLTLGIIFASLPLITVNLSYIADSSKEILPNDNLKISAVSGKIHIDNNWTAAKIAGIVTGNGTYSEPYIIEDFVINVGGSGIGILIENSEVFFKIENCTFYNSGIYNSRITLFNVTNGKLMNNNVSNSPGGIYLISSYNNTVSGNNATNNIYNGIGLVNSDNNIISGNTVNNNTNGINLENCNNNTITGNTVNNNTNGINLEWSNNNNTITGNIANNNYIGIEHMGYSSNISENNASNNDWAGIYLWGQNSNNNTVSGNVMNNNGLQIEEWSIDSNSYEIDTTNLVNGKPLYYYTDETNLGDNNFTNAGQVILINCTDSVISNLNVSDGSTGILLHSSSNNIVSGNTANNNNEYGIFVWGDDNIVSGNIANNNKYYGIYVSGDISIVSGNVANNNEYYGILVRSNDSIVMGNIANNNTSGIYALSSNNNNITRNTANNNIDYGIAVIGDGNIVSGNNLYHNSYWGIIISQSNNNILYFNNFINNTMHARSDESLSSWISLVKFSYTYKGVNHTNYLGNYWDNYTGIDANNDGIGDTPFVMDGIADNYPLMEPIANYEILEILLPETLPPLVIPGYDLFFLIGILSFAVIILNKRLKKS